ncbi:MAG: NAD(P)-dependent oxidoreductase [Phycisphaerales bacterium]|jgi:phosphoglycerate dehydrogenase-like enzyme|nr:NAD(P)-dependent oxidoreductase [Phycisphaerales bacterium]
MSGVPVIVVTEDLTSASLEWLAARADVRRVGSTEPTFAETMAAAAALIVRTYTTVDAAMLDLAPNLRVVGRAGTGLDNIDVDACCTRNITVVNTPDANRQAVVEYVTSILMHMFRPLPGEVQGGLDAAAWAEARRAAVATTQLSQCTLGILGMGHIGRRVAEVAAAVGCAVQYHDVVEIPPAGRFGATSVGLETLLSSSDIVSVHVDGRSDNRHFLNQDRLALLQPHALLINTSRGFVIDGEALAAALSSCPSMRAVLDVHEREPVPACDSLLGLPNARLLPHAASRTAEAQHAMSWVVRDVWSALTGE